MTKYTYCRRDRCIDVSAERCGMFFNSVAQIYEEFHENPLMVVSKPLGMSAIANIMLYWMQYRSEYTGGNMTIPDVL